MNEITSLFGIRTISCETISIGHINRTYLVKDENGEQFILQSISRKVFENPEIVMDNIAVAEKAFRDNEILRIPDFLRCGERLFADVNGEIWRMYRYIPSAECENKVYSTGFSFGSFIKTMNGQKISEKQSIADFHNYGSYLRKLLSYGNVHKGIEVLTKLGETLLNVFKDDIPKRIIHGDAKTDNVITGNPCTVIDLDTVMYGYAALDYGDMLRSVCRKSFDVAAVSELTKGFADGIGGMLTVAERDSLYYGVLWVTGELAVRYITDAVSQERYFYGKSASECLERADELLEILNVFSDKKEGIQNIIQQYFD